MDMRTLSDASYSIYNAVHVVALALHKLFLRDVEMTSSTAADSPVLLPWQVTPSCTQLCTKHLVGDTGGGGFTASRQGDPFLISR